MSRLFCDCCGDIVCVAYPVEVRFPDGAKLTMNVCPDCWEKRFKSSRKHRVASILKILLDE